MEKAQPIGTSRNLNLMFMYGNMFRELGGSKRKARIGVPTMRVEADEQDVRRMIMFHKIWNAWCTPSWEVTKPQKTSTVTIREQRPYKAFSLHVPVR